MPRLLFTAFAALALSANPSLAQTCTTSWTAEEVSGALIWTSGDWDDEDRWDNGVPTASDVACILGPDGRASFTVTVDAPREVGGLVVGNENAFGAVALQLDAELTVLGEGRLFGRDEIDGDLTLEGTFEIENARLATGGGTVTVRAGGELIVAQSTGNGGNGGATQIGRLNGVTSQGTLWLEGGQLEVRESVFAGARLDVDNGTIVVRQDNRDGNSTTLRFRHEGGTLAGLTLDADPETTFSLRGAYTVSGIIGGLADGVAEFSRYSTLEVGAGGVEFAVGGDLGLALSNNDSGGTSELTVTGGEILNSGLLRLPRRPDFDAVTVRSTGTLRVDRQGGADLLNGSQIVIEETGTLLFTDALGQGNRFIYGDSVRDPGDARITLRGRIVEAGNDFNDAIYVPVDVLGGEIAALTGRLDLRAGGTMVNPTLSGEGGAELQLFGEWDMEGTVSGESAATPTAFEDDLSVVLGGSSPDSPTTFRAIGDVTLDVRGAGIELGVSTATTVLTAAPGGSFVNRSAILQKSQTVLRAVTLRNEGEVLGNGFSFEEDARFINASGGTATLRSGVVSDDGTGAFINRGLTQTNQNGSTLSFRGILDSRPGSELQVRQQPGASRETLNLSQEDPASYGAGVTISGDGGVSYPFGTRLQGTISPGTPEAPFDTLGTPDLQFSLTEGAPRLVVDIGDGVSDLVATSDAGVISPGGATLVIRVAPGFTPSPGDEWVVVRRFSSSAPPTGAFPAMEVQGAPAGLTFVQDPDARGAVVVRAAVSVALAAREAEIPEGASGAFVLTHPEASEPFFVRVETGGTASPLSDYTLGLAGGRVRVRANTTQTLLPVFARRDADAGEGPETLTLTTETGATATMVLTDGPSTTALTLGAIAPSTGSNAGRVTAEITGTGFSDGVAVRLTGPASVPGTDVRVLDGGGLEATFDLRSAPVGTYGVEVTSGGTATLAGAFTVTAEGIGGEPPLWVAVSGTPNPRRARFSTYTVTVGNDQPFDLHDALAFVLIPEGMEYEVRNVQETGPPDSLEVSVDVADLIPIYLPRVPAGGTVQIPVRLRPTRNGQFAGVTAYVGYPNPEALFTYSGEADDFFADVAAGRTTTWGTIEAAVERAIEEELGGGRPTPRLHRGGGGGDNVCFVWTPEDGPPLPPPSDPDSPPTTNDPFPASPSISSDISQAISDLDAAADATTRTLNSMGDAFRGIFKRSSASILASGGSGNSSSSSCSGGDAAGSFDPNDKLGPAGAGEANYYRPDGSAFPYTIRFENIETASAPAQEVVIVDTLDASVFDLSTLRLGAVTFGLAGRVEPPANALTATASGWEAEVDLSHPDLGGLDATLLITASLDAASGRLAWRFATLDNQTGDLPEDAQIGFLPPNVDGEGEGAVTFTVETLPGLADGTTVSNGAEIVFDVNEPIVTPVWTNTVDTSPPATSVGGLAAQSQAPFQITVSGGDAGAGVERYALFAQRDGGPFEQVAVSREPVFTFNPPEPGLYGFYSRAIDFVGNVEPPKTEAEATTAVAVDADGGPDLPTVLTLGQPFPNPSRGAVTVRYGLPQAGPITLRVLDVLGREVARLAEGEAPAGWHSSEWAAEVSAGAYVVEVRTGGEVRHARLTVVR